MLEILAILGSLSSIASLALQAGVAQTADGNVDVQEVLGRIELNDEQQQALSVKGSRQIIGLLIIDRDLLDEITLIIKMCLNKYKSGIRKASNRTQQDVVDKEAERCICDALNRIKRRNDGELPPGEFQRWWKSYRCIDDYDY